MEPWQRPVLPPDDWDEEGALGFAHHKPLDQLKPRQPWQEAEWRESEWQTEAICDA